MNPGWAAIAAGAIGLAVFDGVVSRGQAVANVGGVLGGAGRAVDWFLSPAVPAFKVTPKAPASSSGSAASTTAAAAPAAGSTPPSSSASSQPTGTNPTPTVGGPPVYVPSPTGPILEYAV